MTEMVLVTEYRTRRGKREELFRHFETLVAGRGTAGRPCMVWSTSATERDLSILFEFWSDADLFADLLETPGYLEYLGAVDILVKTPPVTRVSVPRLAEGV